MAHFHTYRFEDVRSLINVRNGEEKLGENLVWADPDNWEESLSKPEIQIVILGIPEDFGVRGNHGIGGAHSTWQSFVKAFLNLQSNALPATQIMLFGYFDFDVYENDLDVDALRKHTEQVDKLVQEVGEKIVALGKMPIIIGGGHNNAYPIIKGVSQARGLPINAVNLDPHADFRSLEGRHSGNGFSYAYSEGFLKKYAVLALHEGYNNSTIMKQFLENEDLMFTSFEDIYMRRKINFQTAMLACLDFVTDAPFGVELDLDSLEDVLSSAETPIGVPRVDALHYIYESAKNEQVAYLHLPEGILERSDGKQMTTIGKLLSYFVHAFIKGCLER